MLNTIIKIAGAHTGTAIGTVSDVASIDIPEDGAIWAIDSLLYVTTMSALATINPRVILAELSFLSTSQLGANDARGELQEIGVIYSAEAGAGNSLQEVKTISFPKGIPVQAGERIHAHIYIDEAALDLAFTFLLFLETKGGGRRSTRHR